MIRPTQTLTALLLLLSTESVSSFSFFSNFNYASLVYKIGACHHPGKLCPPPHCGGPGPKPPLCKQYSCSNGDCTWAGNESTCNGDSDCMASNEWYQGQNGYYSEETDAYISDGGGDYNENYQADNYEAANGNYERDYIDGGTDGFNHSTSSASKNFLVYFMIAGVLALFIIVTVIRKREELNGGDLSQDLNPDGDGDGANPDPEAKDIKGSIQERMADMELGRTVSRLDHFTTKPTFVGSDADTVEQTDYVMA